MRQFDDPSNTASIASSVVIDGTPILRVYHDFDKGWQFHGVPQSATPENAKVVTLASMVQREVSIAALYDLPSGWMACREGAGSAWIRAKNYLFPVFADDRFYLEDAD